MLLATGCAALTNLDALRGDGGATADATPSDATPSNDAADASTDATDGGVVFFDDFNRADSNQIGNGWLTKMLAFDIGANALQRVDPNPSISYVDNVVYRPFAESILDVKVSVVVRYASFSNAPYPQIHLRIDPTTVATPAILDSYLFFPTGGGMTGMTIGRQHGSGYAAIGAFAVNPPLDTTHTFRFTFSAKGTASVVLDGTVEVLSGSNWTVAGSGTTTDTDGTRLVTAGPVGLSGSNGEAAGDYTYDDFTVTAL